MHYYQHNIADYRKDTGHLSLLEHGIYRQLLDTYYLDEKPIETQPVMRRLSIKTDQEKTALENVLADFFDCSDCGNYYTHKRCEEEIVNYKAKADQSRINGSKGGRPLKPRKTQPVNSANPDITQTKPNHKPLTNNHKPITKEKTGRFQRPGICLIEDYLFEKTGKPDKPLANKFFNHYEANGWKVGKNAMKNWKAAVNSWLTRENNNENNRPNNSRPASVARLTPAQQLREQIRQESGIDLSKAL